LFEEYIWHWIMFCFEACIWHWIMFCFEAYIWHWIMFCFISVPPRWVIEPEDSFVILKKSVILDCLSYGIPIPKISWKKALGIYLILQMFQYHVSCSYYINCRILDKNW
jgi:hypothetical protein